MRCVKIRVRGLDLMCACWGRKRGERKGRRRRLRQRRRRSIGGQQRARYVPMLAFAVQHIAPQRPRMGGGGGSLQRTPMSNKSVAEVAGGGLINPPPRHSAETHTTVEIPISYGYVDLDKFGDVTTNFRVRDRHARARAGKHPPGSGTG